MPPKAEAAPKGPTIEEFEEEWKRKVQEWENEEKRLIGSVESAESEATFLAQKVALATKEIERLKQQCAEVTRQSDERRVQVFHQTKAAHEMHERDQQTILKQAADVEQLTSKIAVQKAEVKHRSAAVDQATAAHHHHISLVQKRTSLTSMLKERLVRLRSEHVQVEAKLLNTLSAKGVRRPPSKSQRAVYESLALFVGRRTASSSIAAERLRDRFGFDVCHIVLPPALHAMNDMSTAAVPLVEPHPAAFVLGSGGPEISYIDIYDEPAIVSEGGKPLQIPPVDPATNFLDHFSSALMEASLGQHKERRAIVCIAGYAAPGGDSVIFPVDILKQIATASATTPQSSETSSTHVGERSVTVVVPLRDLAMVLCGPLCTQRNTLLLLDVVDPDGSHLVVLATPDSSSPVLVHIAVPSDFVLQGVETELVMSALASLVSRESTWDALAADRLVSKLQIELRELADQLHLRLSTPPRPRWCEDWPQNAPIVSPSCSRPASRVVDSRSATAPPSSYLLPIASTPPLLAASSKWCSVRFFVPSTHSHLVHESAARSFGSFGQVLHAAPVRGAATSNDDQSATYVDFLVANLGGAGLAVNALFATLSQKHRLAHCRLDPVGPNLRISCSTGTGGEVNVVRVAAENGCSTLQECTRCAVALHGSDRIEWERDHRPYDVIGSSIEALSDSLPDGASFTQVTECSAIVCCPDTPSFIAFLRNSLVLQADALQSVFASSGKGDVEPIALWPAVSPTTSYVPLRDIDVGGSFHRLALSKQGGGPSSFQQQTIMCLIVTDGDKSVSHVDQQAEVHAASAYLAQHIPVARSAVFGFVDLTTGLACSKADLAAMTKTAGDDEAIGTALSDKRLCWRKLMQFLPPGAVDFLIRVTYPCLVITSPVFQPGERSILVVPRTLQTLAPVSRKCLFPASTIISATVFFAQELLWQLPQQRRDSSSGDEASQPSSMSSWFMI